MSVVNFSGFNPHINTSNTKTEKQSASKPSFCAQQYSNEGISAEAAETLKNQKINNTIPQLTEDDINFEVTLRGYGETKGNKRKVNDLRCAMSQRVGLNWPDTFNRPHLLYNANHDEKQNGPTTAIIIPLHPKSEGIRGGDHMGLLLSGTIPSSVVKELITYLTQIGLLNDTPIGGKKYYLNTLTPEQTMNNKQAVIKKAIVQFFKQKQAEIVQPQHETETKTEKSEEESSSASSGSKRKFNTTHINIANIGNKQNINNARNVENYIRYFLENNREFTVIYDKYDTNGKEQDITVILLPSKKSLMDCITITIDSKLDKETCKNLINFLVKQKITNVDHPDFRKAIVEYLNNM